MSFSTILSTLLIGPLKLIFEIIYVTANKIIGHPGWSIVVLSLVMNILVLPLYKRADAMQEESRDIEAKLEKGVKHIKQYFSGDERMMILQTYYRQNDYRPTDALNGSVSLLLEVPFFMAAYQFLSGLAILQGATLGPIMDLGAPDALLQIGAVSINVLPVLMTLVNVISSAIYLKGFPLKTKIQLYAMALFFLVFLYDSPSGLVFYWTLNNVFSLVKTIFYKLRNPGKTAAILCSAAGAAILAFAVLDGSNGLKAKLFLTAVGAAMQFPLLLPKLPLGRVTEGTAPNRKKFVLGGLFLTVLVGFLIPSTFIAASPQEYVDPSYFHNPLWYVVSSGCLAAGFFLVWLGVFYWLANPRGKVLFEKLVWVLCGIMLVNYMFFGTDLGIISSNLQYIDGLNFTWREQLLNLLVLAAVAGALLLCERKWERFVIPVVLTAAVALAGMSVLNITAIKKSVDRISVSAAGEEVRDADSNMPHFNLSKEGKNVVVIMLDRAMGELVPYIFNEKPELYDQFDGFTYYSNTISYGLGTNFGVPALLGGYEYTPVEMNRRNTELLVDKHNEAVKLMPVLFSENGYEVTVCDPVLANYQWLPDLSIFDDYPEINSFVTDGIFSGPEAKLAAISKNNRNFFCFSLMKTMPLFLQEYLYDNGLYNQAESKDSSSAIQVTDGIHRASGQNGSFLKCYDVLTNMDQMTQVSEENENTFLFLSNNITHEPVLLQTPEYLPAEKVDNTLYDQEHTERFTVNGTTLYPDHEVGMMGYHANMAAMLQLGKWFDYLREQDVYDNTRIILAADHGYRYYLLGELVVREPRELDLEGFYPLLMVKDFGSSGFETSHEFMTNADVPTLAFRDLIEDPINPFTGKQINSDEKFAHPQFAIISEEIDVHVNNGCTYLPGMWASVKDDLWNQENWEFCYEEIVLDEHVMP